MAYPSWLTQRTRAALTTVAVVLASLLGSGCAAQNQGMAAGMQELRRELNGLRADNLIMKDRLEALEEQRDDAQRHERPAAAVEEVTPSDRPALAVVRLSPETQPSDEPAAASDATAPPPAAGSDAEPRTVIVGNDRGVSQQSASSAGAGGARTPSYRRR